ncbi:MAG TPA: TetR family transcriptional regulator [Methylomirabilota bacterium]|nr:TetR family transcriptional regulator [Methylomirabilota bacterium]
MRDGTRTRERIADTALRLFVEKGIAATSIRDIARGAAVAEGALYRHYASKEDLAWRLFADRYAALGAAVDAVQAAEPGFRGKIEALVRHFCRAFDADPVLFSYLLLTQHDQVRKVTPQMANPLAVVRRVIAEGLAARPDDRRDPAVVSAMVLGLVLQVAVERTYGQIETNLEDLAATLAAACWRIVDTA